MPVQTTPIMDHRPEDLVFISPTKTLITNSLLVAECFNKRHDTILRKISSLECSPKFNAHNFAAVNYHDSKNERRPKYEMTKDGFMFLVMGFTGKRAAVVKEAYINAFNEMAEQFENHLRLPSPPANTIALPNVYHQQILLTVRQGEIVEKRLLTNDELVMNRNRFINYFKEPDIAFNDIEQLAELSRVVNERICIVATK
ncbi:Rha family transcriptional regulator [Vibrio sp. La 4.2.2]|uniref:Rha family transcriptional regulator n=1 Tax=Vibrio sp. La 4.2.2 TaxID=2998830 RepID=UPI0022CDF072|nr:Rha family transcriptional regulator [Vibrio sp. La 4.2.2]MDA0107806.1 Rha family transcriptional regulator [Vibrio sp. La 4.2.2]